ncbi:MAG: transporter substrate-binding domain-containing protein [Ruminococcaceae bacterium]|nr:transporter substrate-binding domain-containing protein [Oscillospiraceae bacterium]
MKRIMALVMVVVLCFGMVAFAGCGKKNLLKVGMTEYEPMNFKDDKGEWTGFDTEFAQKAAKELGYDGVEFTIINWDNKLNELESGAIDCIWNGMTITDQIKAGADVTDAYAKNAQVVVVNKALKESYTPDLLKTLTVAVENGGAAAGILDEMQIKYTPVATQIDALTEVKSGASQACLIDITMANNMLTDDGNYADLTVAEELAEEEYGIAFKKGSELTAKMNEIIKKFKADGTLDAFGKKYDVAIAD